MVRAAHNVATILDAEAVASSRDEIGWMKRLMRHRAERLKPILTRHGGRVVDWPGDGDRAEFSCAAAALGAAIEFQQAVADANQGESEDKAVVFGLRLGLEGDDVATRPGGIVVSATVRDAVAGRVPASFAELGSGLGTVERPVHAYEVGWDPADWPADSAAAASPVTRRGDITMVGRWVSAIAWSMLLLGGLYVAVAPRPAGWRAPAVTLDSARLEGHAEEIVARWRAVPGQVEDGVANAGPAEPSGAHDGLYAGALTTRAEGRLVNVKLQVTDGVGLGTQSQRECGTTRVRLKVSPDGEVSGFMPMFGPTCLKTDLPVKGRAVGDTLMLRVGTQYLELSRPND